MIIKIDDQIVFELTAEQEKVIKNDVDSNIFFDDMKRRVIWVLETKYKNCLKRMKDEWIPKFKDEKVSSVPLDDDEFAKLVLSHPKYEDRRKREENIKIAKEELSKKSKEQRENDKA